ncbi:MAG: SGNH/GDSL hydrolase family protein [Planctomycetota bacterium]|nr:MAG: SGNH/GDSL hydrolase family protein [Planctomycetota bacterium]
MMHAGSNERRALRVVTVSALITILVLLGGYAAFGDAIVRAAYEGRSPLGPLNRMFHFEGRAPFAVIRRQAAEHFWSVVIFVIALWALFAIVDCAVRAKHRRLVVPLAVLVWWFGVELCAAPFLVFTLRLRQYRIIRDVDHRPPPSADRKWNADGLRSYEEAAAFRPEGLNLVFLGDSFTYGMRVKAAQAFPARVGDFLRGAHPRADVRIANFGWTSSSPLLSYRRLVDIGEKYSPDIVVLCIDMTDFQDDIRYRDMLDRRGLYRLYDKLPITLKLFETIAPEVYKSVLFASVGNPPRARFFVTEAPLEETRPWFEPLVRNVREIHEWCRQRDVDFVLVILPRGYQYSDRESPRSWERDRYTAMGPYVTAPFEYFDELREHADYPIVALLDAFREAEEFPTCFEDDPHWNTTGHDIAAIAIARALSPIVAARSGR